MLGTFGAAELTDLGGPTPTVPLQAGGPAIDAALAGFCASTDQRGIARPQGSGCDIGAFEVVQEPARQLTIELQPDSMINVRLVAEPNSHYSIETSTDLSKWSVFADAWTSSAGVLEKSDSIADCVRFYRATTP